MTSGPKEGPTAPADGPPDSPGPGLATLFRLVTGLRFTLFLRRLGGRGMWGTALAWLLSLSLATGLGVLIWMLFSRVPAIRNEPIWRAFTMGMCAFLIGLFWIIWPLVAAQVDEAFELGRYFHFPIKPGRLYAVQTTAGLVEPSVLFFYPALAGMLAGVHASIAPTGWMSTWLVSAFVLMNVTAGRCLLSLFLNILTSRRSGEILFALFLVLLGLSALLPEVDASWLFAGGDLFESMTAGPRLQKLAITARLFGQTPPGLLARGLAASAAGAAWEAFWAGAGMLALAALAWILGLWLTLRFYRGDRGGKPSRARSKRTRGKFAIQRWPLIGDATAAVLAREWRSLGASPKARMLFAVPFFLVIILKIVGAWQLLRYWWGDWWTALLLLFLGLYLLSVLGGQFFANGFGYDGHAVRWPFLSPASPKSWLIGRNLAQASMALLQMIGLVLLVLGMFPGARLLGLGLSLSVFTCGLLMLLGLGNLLSVRYPRRFHYQLARRDRAASASVFWVLLILSLSGLAGTIALGSYAVSPALYGLILGLLPLLGFGVYRRLLPIAVRTMHIRREALISAITR